MAYTNPSTFVAGNVLTAAQLNTNLRDNMRFFHGVPTARVHRDVAQSVTSGAWNGIQFDTEEWDSNTIWSSTSNTKLFCRTAGKYLVIIYGGFANSTAGGIRGVAIQKNTTTAGAGHEAECLIDDGSMGALSMRMPTSMLVSLTTGQYVRMEMFHDAGVGLNTSTDDGLKPRLAMIWMSS